MQFSTTTGTSASTTYTASTSTLTLNFVLTPASVPLGAGLAAAASGKPAIEFNMSNATETLVGYGQLQ